MYHQYRLKKFFLMFTFEGEREMETQNPEQAPGSELVAQSLTRTQTHEPWDHDLNQSQTLNWWSHPGVSPHPIIIDFNKTKKVTKEIKALNNTINKLELLGEYRILYSKNFLKCLFILKECVQVGEEQRGRENPKHPLHCQRRRLHSFSKTLTISDYSYAFLCSIHYPTTFFF